jgi:hypothetical protein
VSRVDELTALTRRSEHVPESARRFTAHNALLQTCASPFHQDDSQRFARQAPAIGINFRLVLAGLPAFCFG